MHDPHTERAAAAWPATHGGCASALSRGPHCRAGPGGGRSPGRRGPQKPFLVKLLEPSGYEHMCPGQAPEEAGFGRPPAARCVRARRATTPHDRRSRVTDSARAGMAPPAPHPVQGPGRTSPSLGDLVQQTGPDGVLAGRGGLRRRDFSRPASVSGAHRTGVGRRAPCSSRRRSGRQGSPPASAVPYPRQRVRKRVAPTYTRPVEPMGSSLTGSPVRGELIIMASPFFVPE